MKKIYCQICGKGISNDEIALNIKIIGKQVSKLRCYKCLSIWMECDISVLMKVSEYYKTSGCSIFKTKYTVED